MMSIDFEGEATFEQSRSFSEELTRLNWQKINKLNTVWQTFIEEDFEDDNIFELIRTDVNFALQRAGIKKAKAEIFSGSSKFVLV